MTTAFGIVVVFVLSGVAIADASPMQALSLKLERASLTQRMHVFQSCAIMHRASAFA